MAIWALQTLQESLNRRQKESLGVSTCDQAAETKDGNIISIMDDQSRNAILNTRTHKQIN